MRSYLIFLCLDVIQVEESRAKDGVHRTHLAQSAANDVSSPDFLPRQDGRHRAPDRL